MSPWLHLHYTQLTQRGEPRIQNTISALELFHIHTFVAKYEAPKSSVSDSISSVSCSTVPSCGTQNQHNIHKASLSSRYDWTAYAYAKSLSAEAKKSWPILTRTQRIALWFVFVFFVNAAYTSSLLFSVCVLWLQRMSSRGSYLLQFAPFIILSALMAGWLIVLGN